ncbi:sensor histidine kinase [Oceanobacillus alkalisoli]|uniref:sensor histidine kinase n=1 Tax=Oceanobacillus alkalisoli TaxID=2925113 RepID=UPI001EF08245|nr:HAMP domain-containing sensor histidine kinase [Oceanobacillus alkalisoli]MCF3944979.1 HAMP domain-containing histidine kinase [Oceanobacillus alkalisoli]MCG5103661.1 HAMP domain-containing histidine kinase [Oceanobacillus alkalisoli]
MRNFFRSLLAKYMLLIVIAIFLVQIATITIALFVYGFAENVENRYLKKGIDTETIEESWHEEASHLEQVSEEGIQQHFAEWKEDFPEATMFWVDGAGILREQIGDNHDIPTEWTAREAASFIKSRYDGDPFTVIALMDEADGFIVFEIPRDALQLPMQSVYDHYGEILIIGLLLIVLLFIIVSFLFFHRIRKRLLHLQEAMEIRDVDGLPLAIPVKKKDEIGQLEQTFNQMVAELRKSKQREQEEERLRKELIANLSHDLRTPLTKLRAQSYSISKMDGNEELNKASQQLDVSINDMDRLIENLMSYTLLTASKYQLKREKIDMVRYVREHLATWYSVFEREGFEINIDMQSLNSSYWMVDPVWISRIMDNLLQNILRHANEGKYVEVKTKATETYDAFLFIDKGSGIDKQSEYSGAGIGLSIVDMMVKGLNLDWEIRSSNKGTTVKIINYHKK